MRKAYSCFIGILRLLMEESCSGLCSVGWWMSDPQSNNRMAESLITFTTHPEIPSSTGFSQGNLGIILRNWYIQPGLKSWDLHQQEVHPQPAKNLPKFSLSWIQEALISLNFESLSVLVIHTLLFTREGWSSLVTHLLENQINHKQEHLFPSMSSGGYQNVSFDRY